MTRAGTSAPRRGHAQGLALGSRDPSPREQSALSTDAYPTRRGDDEAV